MTEHTIKSSKVFALRIAIPTPLRRTFDYLPAKNIDPTTLKPGIRIRVPFGRRDVIGILLEAGVEPCIDVKRLKPIKQVLDSQPLIPADILKLLQWASQYYQYPVGESLQLALPVLLRQGEPAIAPGVDIWSLTTGTQQVEPETLKRAPRQQALLAVLQQKARPCHTAELDILYQDWRPVMKRLEEKGLVIKSSGSCLEAITTEPTSLSNPLQLNSDQQTAVDHISQHLHHFHTSLLDGITGSGKTEVYLQLIAKVLEAGQQALVLVPEIGLTPQLLQRFQARFATPIALLHSALNEKERLCAWLKAAEGEAGIIIGTRSALFTPLARPGLFIIDEEHDLSFKQQEGLRYSARDLMVMRARILDIPVILGSATPTLESLYNCEQQRFSHLRLSQRAGNARPPTFRLIDVRSQKLEYGISTPLRNAMQHHLEKNGQVLIFINRRGFAPVLLCHDCGWHSRCDRCDAHMTLHQASNRQRCHHCGSERPTVQQCPKCGKQNLFAVGYGTQRVAEALAVSFPDVPVLRIDRDSTRRKGAMQEMLEQIASGQPQILVGTQMLAKGHHFPNLTLVAVLDADYGLFSADFRAPERLGQLVLQVAGRAGRESKPGEVLIQTHHPDSPLLKTLMSQDYTRYAADLMDERKQTCLPPYTSLALLRAEATDFDLPLTFLRQAADICRSTNNPDIELFGPFPAPMERRAGKSRAQLLFQTNERAKLQSLLAWLAQQLEGHKLSRKVRWSLDVDPQEMF
jgi:primosomal protein N' (replication factor Y)